MSWFRKLAATIRPRRLEESLDEELRFHLEQRTDHLIAQGVPPEEARRQAARIFGNRTQLRERTRDRDILPWLASTMQDVRFAYRTLRKQPTFTVVSVLTLALGIGAITAVFTVVNGVILRPLPYPDPDRLVTVWEANPAFPRGVRFSPGNYLDLRSQNRSFAQVGGFAFDRFNLTGRGEPERVTAGLLSAGLFPMLGIRPAIGRGFEPADDSWTAPPVAILSYSLWQRLGGTRDIVGSAMRLDGQACTVVGVMPPGIPLLPYTEDPAETDVWLPLERTRDPETMHWRFSYYVGVIARLKPGVTAAQAQEDVSQMVKGIQKRWPDNLGRGAQVVPLHQRTVDSVRRPLLVLLGAVVFVLLIACANVASLNLGRSAARRREIAVRLALGAGRARVTRQLLTESLLVGMLGAVLGLGLAVWGVAALLKLAPPELPRATGIRLDRWVLAFTMAVSAATSALFGLWPAWSAAGGVPEGLAEGGRTSSTGPHGARVRSLLVVAEMALALILMVGAGLMMESFRRVVAVDPGFRAEGLVTMRVPLSETAYDGIARQSRFYDQFLERVRAIPGLQSVGAIDGLPFSDGGFDNMFEIAGRPAIPGQGLSAEIRRTDAGYFRTMGIPLLQGRGFAGTDRRDTPDVAVISHGMAEHYWPRESAIGKRLAILFGNPNIHPTIVGVVGDVLSSLDSRPRDTIYVPYPQGRHVSDLYVVLRPEPGAGRAALAQMVRAAATSLDAEQPVYRVHSMEELLAASVATRNFEMVLLGLFAAVAVSLAAIGLYGILAYSVEVRTREIGIRTALGATREQILRMVVRDAARLVGAGMAIGWVGALILTRSLTALLYGVKPGDPLPYVAMSVVLALIAVPSAWVPARKAARVEPLTALRS